MRVLEYKEGGLLRAIFRGYAILVEKEPCGPPWYGQWSMFVTDRCGYICCDGFVKDSSNIDLRSAFVRACEGALIDPPKRWPRNIV